jgi:hypothetical protein
LNISHVASHQKISKCFQTLSVAQKLRRGMGSQMGNFPGAAEQKWGDVKLSFQSDPMSVSGVIISALKVS